VIAGNIAQCAAQKCRIMLQTWRPKLTVQMANMN